MQEYSPQRLRRILVQQLPLLVWLIFLWCALWGTFSWLNLLTGILVAGLVVSIFYLPPVQLSGRFNPLWGLVFIVTFVWDVIRGSIHVAWLSVNPQRLPKSSVIAVHLNSRSDLIMLLVSFNISLVPGSLVVEADRYRSILYVHAFDTEDAAGVEHARWICHRIERRIVRVIGSKDDLRRVEAAWRES